VVYNIFHCEVYCVVILANQQMVWLSNQKHNLQKRIHVLKFANVWPLQSATYVSFIICKHTPFFARYAIKSIVSHIILPTHANSVCLCFKYLYSFDLFIFYRFKFIKVYLLFRFIRLAVMVFLNHIYFYTNRTYVTNWHLIFRSIMKDSSENSIVLDRT
jgi:hypothetical protein